MFRLARFYSTRPPSPPRRIRTRTVLYACTAVTTGAAALYLTYPTQRRAAPTSATLPLERNHWTPVTVKFSSATLKGSNSKLITLSLPPALIPKDKSPVFSIFVKDDDIQVERPYTPLTGIEPNGDIHLWVKKYERGEVGRWLHSKKLGEQIEIRGPDQTFEWAKDQWDDIIMVKFPSFYIFDQTC